jgi:PAS domain S-box-containing protein
VGLSPLETRLQNNIGTPVPNALEHVFASTRMFDRLPLAVFCCDLDGVIRYANPRTRELLGHTPDGAHFTAAYRLLLPDGGRLAPEEWPTARALGSGEAVKDLRLILERTDDQQLTIIVNVEPFFDKDDESLIGTMNYFQADVSANTYISQAEVESGHMAAIVSSSLDAIISKSLNGIVQTWNAAATEIFGYEASEMIGQPITRLIPPERVHEEEDILGRLRRGERIDHFETVRIGKGGRRIDISLTISPIRDRSGRIIGASKIARDIGDRKRAEEVQRRLIKELNHRVKNTLATVQSLANQTARLARSPTEFAASFSERIQALAQTHDLLTQHSWRGADLMTILRERVLSSEIEEGRVRLSGPDVSLDPQTALHMALVLHELTANARRYGSLSVPGGTLSVRWTIDGGDGSNLRLRWEERGGPAVAAPTSRGLGTSLITRSLAAHDGEVSLSYEPAGVICEIDLPLPLPTANVSANNSAVTAIDKEKTLPPAARQEGDPLRVLVVEDEATIAFDLISDLTELGCTIIGPAATLSQAHRLINSDSFDLALLDANLDGEPVDGLASALAQRNIPFAFLSGYGREELPKEFRATRLVRKPFTFEQVQSVVQELGAAALDTGS